MSNLPALAASIVHMIRNSRGDSAHNQATVVQNMIAEAMKSEVQSLKELIHHAYIHDNYRDLGISQMTTPQKKQFLAVLEELGMPESADFLKQWVEKVERE